MQLNKFTDYALRVLMYVSPEREQPYTIAEIAQDLHVSQHHLVKIVHFMAKQDWIITTRGKGGGIRLHPRMLTFRLGQLVRILQGDQQIVECNTPPCVLRKNCGLKGILDQSLEAFYRHLDQYCVADVIQHSATKPNTGNHADINTIPLLNL